MHTLGYYIALLPQIGCTGAYMTSVSIMITFFGGICTAIEACVDDLSSSLIPQMNKIAAEFTTNGHNSENALKLRYKIFDMIELHTDILRYLVLNGHHNYWNRSKMISIYFFVIYWSEWVIYLQSFFRDHYSFNCWCTWYFWHWIYCNSIKRWDYLVAVWNQLYSIRLICIEIRFPISHWPWHWI